MATHGTDSEETFILATQLADGTWCWLRCVKGFVPWEEVPPNENIGKQLVAAAKKKREKQERAKARKPSVAEGAVAATPKAYRPSQLQGAVLPKTNAISGVNGNTAITKTIRTLTKNFAELKLKQDDDDRLRYELKKLKKKLGELESIEAHMKKREKDQLDKVKRIKDVKITEPPTDAHQ